MLSLCRRLCLSGSEAIPLPSPDDALGAPMLIVDTPCFWQRFEACLVTAVRRYAISGVTVNQEGVLQRYLGCLLESLAAVTFEETAFKKDLFTGMEHCYPGQYLPHYLGPVDLALKPGNTGDIGQWIGIEVKVCTNTYGKKNYRRIDYFSNGVMGHGGFDPSGQFLQNGQPTFCKEGQIAQDYYRAVRILSRQTAPFFLLCGVFHYREVAAADLLARLERLLALVRCRRVVYRWRKQRYLPVACLTRKEQAMSYEARVLPTGISDYFGYYVVVRKPDCGIC